MQSSFAGTHTSIIYNGNSFVTAAERGSSDLGMRDPRVFITGAGLLAPTGASPGCCFQALLEGTTGLGFDNDFGLAVGRLHPDAERLVVAVRERRAARRLDRTAIMAIAAAEQAAKQAGCPATTAMGVIVGTSRGAARSLEEYHARFLSERRSSAGMSPVTTGVTLSSAVAAALKCEGPVFTVSSACQSGLTALGTAMALIQSGQAEQFIAGGAESCLTAFTLGSLNKLGLLSHSRAQYPLQPGEPDRDGTVLAEGAALFVLESQAALQERGATPLAEIVAFAQSSEASTLTGISAEAEALQGCLRNILSHGMPDLVIGHLPGTVAGDDAEMRAYRRTLCGSVLIAGLKWSTGHMLGASPGFSVAMALECMQRGLVPRMPCATAGNLIPGAAGPHVSRPVDSVLVAGTGFGGNAAAMLLRGIQG